MDLLKDFSVNSYWTNFF